MNWGNFFFNQPVGGGVFNQKYRCHSVAFKKPELEGGGKIILPASALDQLARLNIDWPMLFRLSNPALPERKTHCGVLEFTAEEGHVYLPFWMMQLLLIEEGALLSVSSATLPKGKFVKVQPHSSAFLDIANPRAVLENRFRGFSALSQGDVIKMEYNGKHYYLSIIEVQPSQPNGAISIIETDVEVDFSPPLDQTEAQPTAMETTQVEQTKSEEKVEKTPTGTNSPAFTGKGFTLSGKAVEGAPVPAKEANIESEEEEEESSEDETGFKAFSGKGYSLKQ